MKLYQVLSCLLFPAILSSCRQEPGKILPGTWYITEMRYPGLDKFIEAMPIDAREAGAYTAFTYALVQGDYFNFHSNGSFTSFSGAGRFTYGTWRFDPGNGVIRLTMARRKDSMLLRLVKLESSKMVVSSVSYYGFNKMVKDRDTSASGIPPRAPLPDSLPILLTLEKEKAAPLDEKDDFTSLGNNAWRFQPATPESKEQIRQRVISAVRFAIMYLSARMAKEEASTSIRPIVLPATMTARGINIDPDIDIRQSWRGLFYNDDDAMTGYKIFRDAFYKRKVASLKYGVELNIVILKETLQNIQ